MFRDTEPKVARFREIAFLELVLFHLESSFENLFSFGSANGDMHGDLFVAADAERADGVSSFACDIICIRKLLRKK